MDFELSEEQRAIRDSVLKLCAPFDDHYWLEKDLHGGFPEEFHAAIARGGWLGIAMPEKFGGAGQGLRRLPSSCRPSRSRAAA